MRHERRGSDGKGRHGIEVEGLVRQFKDVRAVDGIDLRIEPGQIYASSARTARAIYTETSVFGLSRRYW
jgi:hypothetical protein